jgi:hypothetical protein
LQSEHPASLQASTYFLFCNIPSGVGGAFNQLHFKNHRLQFQYQFIGFFKVILLWRTSFLLRIVRALFPEFALRHRPTESLIGVPRPVRSIVLNVAFCSYVKESWHPSAVGFPVIAKLIKYYWSTLATVPLNGSPSSIVEVIHIEECVWKIPSVQCRRHRK